MAGETVGMSPDFRIKITMSMSRALWGEVPHYLRVVTVRVLGDRAFAIDFYLDGDNTDDFFQGASDIEGEVMGDFPPDFEISHNLIRRDAPERIAAGDNEILIFRRREYA